MSLNDPLLSDQRNVPGQAVQPIQPFPANDPVEEWRRRWQAGGQAPIGRQPRQPSSPWVYALAAFGGTVAALMLCGAAAIGLLVWVAANQDDFDPPAGSLAYRNDTEHAVWVYECSDRCETILWSFYLAPDDWTYYSLEWYDENPVDWVVVSREDRSYGCIDMQLLEGETVNLSTAVKCPSDIHSPENDVM
jgi:hypothetical protein